jgi:transcriptional regulator with XRE-family HTH domain
MTDVARPGGNSPTVQQRLLGAELRRLRRAAGVIPEDAAARLSVHVSTISRLETGHGSFKPLYVESLCELYGITGDTRDGLVERAKGSKQARGWWQSYTDVMSTDYRDYVGLEDEADGIRNYEPLLVPGLLQTEDYARAVVRATWLGAIDDQVERAVVVRMARQRRRLGSLKFSAIVDEAALRRPTGGADVMHQQLQRLLATPVELFGVIPAKVGAHAGMSGPFSVIHFEGREELDTVYVDGVAGQIFLDKPADIDRCNGLYDRLLRECLNEEDTRELITEIMRELP